MARFFAKRFLAQDFWKREFWHAPAKGLALPDCFLAGYKRHFAAIKNLRTLRKISDNNEGVKNASIFDPINVENFLKLIFIAAKWRL